jgi:hypothetical protein
MSIGHSPQIVTNGLVFNYDMNNYKSFKGAPTTNLLDGASVNGYPTFGNSWGTYNVNYYNSAQYFSIGTVSSVSSNIVTTAGTHGLRSYDVLCPQTTGGGLSAGANYLIKQLSGTTFSLHNYNSSQDGSQGYINPTTGNHKVYDDFALDNRIDINATSFPTMWWGPPHLPNSGLVKEIIVSGFQFAGRINDCMRLHCDRPDGVTDGMAYGALAQVTIGVPYTVSFYARAVTPSAVGASLSYQIYNYGTVAGADSFALGATLGAVGVWQRYSMTFTPTHTSCISYWFPSRGNMKVDLACIQFEQNSYGSQFVMGTRSNTQAIVDLTGNNTLTATSLTYASDNTFSFNGTSNYISCGNLGTFYPQGTVSFWMNAATITNYPNPFATHFQGSNAGIRFEESVLGNNFGVVIGNDAGTYSSHLYIATGMTANTWYNITLTWIVGSNIVVGYLNGVQVFNEAQTLWATTMPSVTIGNGFSATRYWNGKISATQIYNRALSAAEVSQNFQALRGRYGL